MLVNGVLHVKVICPNKMENAFSFYLLEEVCLVLYDHTLIIYTVSAHGTTAAISYITSGSSVHTQC